MIVLLHGWLMGPSMWKGVHARLDRPMLALRHPAHGGDPAPDTPWALAQWAAWAEAQIGDLDPGELVLVGHSMGGMLALALAARRRPRAMVLVGTTYEAWTPDVADAWLGLVSMVEHGWSPELAVQVAPMLVGLEFLGRHPDWSAAWAAEVGGWDRAGMSNFAAAVARRPSLREAAASGVPTLVVHGEADLAIPSGAGRDLARVTGGEFVLMPDVGHCPPMEAPDAFAETLADFLDQV